MTHPCRPWRVLSCRQILFIAITAILFLPGRVYAQPSNPLPATRPDDGNNKTAFIPSPPAWWSVAEGGTGFYYQAVLVPTGITWADARSWALAHGGQLASIGSAKANDFIYQLVRDRRYWRTNLTASGRKTYCGPWLGGQQRPSAEGTNDWFWADQSQPFTYTNWAGDHQPGEQGQRLHYYSEHIGVFSKTWNDQSGSEHERGFVVEYRSPSLAPAGIPLETLLADPVVAWTETSGGPTRYFQAVSAPRAIFWSEAQAIAAAHGGHLVTITSAAQNEFIFALVNDDRFWAVYKGNSNGPLLGGYRAPNPTGGTQWIWAGNQLPFTYANWAPGQPDNSNSTIETRLHYYVAGGNGARRPTWNDQPESANQFGFVIEYGGQAIAVPPGSEPDAIPVASNYSVSSPVRWFSADGGNNHWYQAISSPNGVKWSDAAAWASAHGGYLATINSAAENNFVFHLVDQARFWANDQKSGAHGPWLGGVKSSVAMTAADGWSWVSGGDFYVYTKWTSGQPNNSDQDDRVQFYSPEKNMRTSGWNDAPGEKPILAGKGFVVEYDYAPQLFSFP